MFRYFQKFLFDAVLEGNSVIYLNLLPSFFFVNGFKKLKFFKNFITEIRYLTKLFRTVHIVCWCGAVLKNKIPHLTVFRASRIYT